MSATLNEIKRMIDSDKGVYFEHPRKETLLMPMAINGELISLFIELGEDGEWLRFFIPKFLSVKSAPTAFFHRLLELNRMHKVGAFAYNPRTGEVSLDAGIPIEDAELSHKQLKRAIYAVCGIVREYKSELTKLAGDRLGAPDGPTDPQPAEYDETIVRKLLEQVCDHGDTSGAESLENDTVSLFVAQKCVLDSEEATDGNQLYRAYTQFCEESKVSCQSRRDFNRSLRGVTGVSPRPGTYNRQWVGIKVRELV